MVHLSQAGVYTLKAAPRECFQGMPCRKKQGFSGYAEWHLLRGLRRWAASGPISNLEEHQSHPEWAVYSTRCHFMTGTYSHKCVIMCHCAKVIAYIHTAIMPQDDIILWNCLCTWRHHCKHMTAHNSWLDPSKCQDHKNRAGAAEETGLCGTYPECPSVKLCKTE